MPETPNADSVWVEFNGARWAVADAEWDESSLGVGSHWHLTLTGPLCDVADCPALAQFEVPPVRYCNEHAKAIRPAPIDGGGADG